MLPKQEGKPSLPTVSSKKAHKEGCFTYRLQTQNGGNIEVMDFGGC